MSTKDQIIYAKALNKLMEIVIEEEEEKEKEKQKRKQHIKIRDMTVEQLREYKRDKARQYNDKPKIQCPVCERMFKPCSKRLHLKTDYHKMALKFKNQTQE